MTTAGYPVQFNFCPPALIFLTDDLPDGIGGRANGPVVRIRRKHERDFGLIAHELEHVLQWWVTLGLHPLFYVASKHYRTWSEARAYAEQIHYPRADGSLMSLEEAAERFARVGYGLNLTMDQAAQAIAEQF